MKRFSFIFSVAIVWATLSVPATADWSIGEPNKWIQLPDKEPTGIDISAMNPIILADDFLCTEAGFITDIHIWGSWLDDRLPMPPTGGPGNPADVTFRLAIHADIPADGNTHSMPEMPSLQQWSFAPGTFDVNEYATDVDEGFLSPPSQYFENSDSVIWQYNFSLDEPFYQQGTKENPVVYWLSVSAEPNDNDGQAFFGWKTSLDHWNDDATFLVPGIPGWQELLYPDGHTYQGESIDLAFVITPEPVTIAFLGLGSLTLIRGKRGV